MPSQDLHGRVALLTGASSAIGATIARRLAASGADIALTGRNRARLDALAAELRPSGTRVAVEPIDLRDHAAFESLPGRVDRALGHVQILVNGAGTEVAVTPRPVRPLLALAALAPRLGERIAKAAGVTRFARDAARAGGRLP